MELVTTLMLICVVNMNYPHQLLQNGYVSLKIVDHLKKKIIVALKENKLIYLHKKNK